MIRRFIDGNRLINFIPCDEPIVPTGDNETPLTWVAVVIKKDDRYLLIFNIKRIQWECAGGGIEVGESVEETAIREVLEESSQHVIDLRCRGVFKMYVKKKDCCEYGALYSGTIDELQPFIINNESSRIMLWHPDEDLDDRLGELSQWMIEYLRSV